MLDEQYVLHHRISKHDHGLFAHDVCLERDREREGQNDEVLNIR